jgi:NTE family protein
VKRPVKRPVKRALVLGGGGVTGVAWELGVLAALQAGGVPVADVDLVVGTSAGSVVGAQLTSGVPLDRLVERQLEPPETSMEPDAEIDVEAMGGAWMASAQQARDPEDFRARIGSAALAADTVPERERIEVIRSRLPSTDWPAVRLLITAVDTATGRMVVFDRDAGVPLPLAVAASCAVPLVWPPVTIEGRRYMDGGIRSVTNADLAAGHDAVLVLAPILWNDLGPLMSGLDSELRELPPDGKVVVVSPDEASMDAIGPNPLDPRRRPGAARSGLTQGAALVEQAAPLWASASPA